MAPDAPTGHVSPADYQTGTEEELAALIKGKMCLSCERVPQAAWGGFLIQQNIHVIKCECWPVPAFLGRQPSRVARRYERMVDQALTKRPEVMPLSLEDIKQFISPDATETEAHIFLRFCQAQGLNPFNREAYLLTYQAGKPASIVVHYEVYLKRASRSGHWKGYKSGVIVENPKGELIERLGSVMGSRDALRGAWCEVYRDDFPEPFKVTVNLEDFDKKQANWNTMKPYMIEKVAVSKGHRHGFPDETAALSQAEGITVEVGDVLAPSIEENAAPMLDASEPAADIPDESRQGGATDSVAVPASDDQPFYLSDDVLETCPEHDTPWITTGDYAPYHGKKPDYCRIGAILFVPFRELWGKLGSPEEEISQWLKDNFEGNAWSRLKPVEQLAAVRRLAGLVADQGA